MSSPKTLYLSKETMAALKRLADELGITMNELLRAFIDEFDETVTVRAIENVFEENDENQ